MVSTLRRLSIVAGMAVALAGCQDDPRFASTRHLAPLSPKLVALLNEKGMAKSEPVLIRSFKKEAEIEVWKRTGSGEYALLKTYPICRWSGQLGPKVREGDRQAPEGFYAITPAQLNPNSSYYLSFDTGFPNAYDRANGRSGSFLMVHGACSSRGCFSMTDEQIAEIYALGRESFAGGQRSFQFQSFPFRMTAENMARHRNDPNIAFWRMLKEGSDHFELTRREPQVGVCGKRYVFDAQSADGTRLDPNAPCPALKVDEDMKRLVAEKQRTDNARIAELVARGTPAIKLVYDDGGQHPSFRKTVFASASGDNEVIAPQVSTATALEVSRPEALERGPIEIELDSSGKPKPAPVAVALAPLTPAAPKTPVVASASPTPAAAPVAAASVTPAASGERPFLKRVLSLGGLLSSRDEAASGVETPTGTVLPATAPLPPRRQAASPSTPSPSTPAAKPQAGASAPDAPRASRTVFGFTSLMR